MWKDIKDYEDLYEISTEGFIRNKTTGRILKPDNFTRKRGRKQVYLRITLSKNNIQKRYSISRLVASTFLEGESEEVNHKDGDRLNNSLENLEWVTKEENLKHAMETGLIPRGEDHGNSKYCEVQVLLILRLSRKGYSRKDTAHLANTTLSFVKDVRAGRVWKHITQV